MPQFIDEIETTPKVHRNPVIYELSRPQVNLQSVRVFIEDHCPNGQWKVSHVTEPGDVIPEICGRVCYMSFDNPRPGGNASYLEHLKSCGHGSVLEHTTFGFIFTGVSRTLTHELVRHRAGFAYSMLSQRYVDESDVGFVCPIEYLNNETEYDIWFDSIKSTLISYRRLIAETARRYSSASSTVQRKAMRQSARSVLPGCTETKIAVTGNARAWRHFLEQRGSAEAEPEIRRLAVGLLTRLQSLAPNLFMDYSTQNLPDGIPEITTPYRKV